MFVGGLSLEVGLLRFADLPSHAVERIIELRLLYVLLRVSALVEERHNSAIFDGLVDSSIMPPNFRAVFFSSFVSGVPVKPM